MTSSLSQTINVGFHAVKVTSELKAHSVLFLCAWENLLSSQVHPEDSQQHHSCTYSTKASSRGRMTAGKWHLIIWLESNGFEACLEDMTKHLAPSAGSKLMACMTKSDLISLSVRHFKSRRVKALSAHAEGKSVRQNSAIEGGNWVGGGLYL